MPEVPADAQDDDLAGEVPSLKQRRPLFPHPLTLPKARPSRLQHFPAPYFNSVLEQDHRFAEKRIAASLWFRSVDGAFRTIEGYEVMNMIRKGQIGWLAKGDTVGQVRFIERVFGIAA
jgi:hypothetical protein